MKSIVSYFFILDPHFTTDLRTGFTSTNLPVYEVYFSGICLLLLDFFRLCYLDLLTGLTERPS